jgi:hypothetical protein
VTVGQPALTAIGSLTTTDPNPGQTFTYKLSGANTNLFTVDNSTGTLETNGIFLGTTVQTYQLQVQSTDTLGGSVSNSFTITVNPSTTPPTDITLSNASVSAGRVAGTVIGVLGTTDPNAGQTFTYSLSGPNASAFTVDNTTGTLQTNAIFLIDTVQTYQLQVQTTDTLGLTFSKTFTITVNPSTTPPTDIGLSNTTISAGKPIGTTVGTLSTVDPNAGQAFGYSLGGPNAGLFSVDSSGTIKTAAVFLNTTQATYSLQVQTLDTLNLSFTKALSITVNPSMLAPTDISLSNNSISAGEPTGTVIGVLGTSDPNAGQSFTYTLSGTNASSFAVDNATGSLKTNTIFLNSSVQTVSLQVQTTDNLGLSFTKTFTITINPSTTPPTDISLSNAAVSAGMPSGAVIGGLGTTDPNAGQAFTYSLSGPSAGLFAVDNNTGNLLTNSIFLNTTVQSYQLQVQTTDTLGLSFTKTLSITVNPSTNPPTDISLSSTTVSAGKPAGTAIGILGTTDPNAGQNFTYTLQGASAGLFAVDNASGTLQTGTIFQNSTVQAYQLTVISTDTLGLSFTKTFTITVNPSTTPPTDVSVSNTSVTAYRAAGAAIGVFGTTDPNAGQTFTYSLSGPNAGLFQVDNTGTLKTATVFQNTAVKTYQLQVKSTDTLGLSFSKTLTITVNPSARLPHLSATGSNQTTEVGQSFGNNLTATLTDANGKPLAGVAVTFQTPAQGASGAFRDGRTGISDKNGQVSKVLTANTVTGAFSVGVQVGGGLVSTCIVNLSNLPGSAARIGFVQNPGMVMSGTLMTPAVTVQVQDRYGNPVAQPGMTIQLSLAGGKLKGTLSRQTNAHGLAVFNDLSVMKPGTYKLTAHSSALGTAVSGSFTVKVNPYLVRRIYHR